MIRTVRGAALTAVLAAAALVTIPATAAADDSGTGPDIVINNIYQVAGGGIFNAGGDNIVGNGTSAGEMPGLVVPGSSTVVAFEVRNVPYPGLSRVSQEGGDYPEFVPPSYRVFVPVGGASTVVYQSDEGRGHVTITLKAGETQPTCTSDGNLGCEIDPRSQDFPRPLIIDGR